MAYNFARRLKTLKGLTPYEYICKIWTTEPERFMINPHHHTTGLNTGCIGRTRGGLISKIHVVCNEQGKPLVMMLSEGQMNDHKGADLLLHSLPKAKNLIADRGYDSQRFRSALREMGITPCIPGRQNLKTQPPYDKKLYRQRHKIENFFARLKDWCRISMRSHLLLCYLYRCLFFTLLINKT